MKRKTLFLLLLLIAFNIKGQHHLDSLWAVWKNPSIEDTMRALALMDYIWKGPLNNQPDSAILLNQELYEFSHQIGFLRGKVDAMEQNGYMYFRLGKYPQALESYNHALRLSDSIDYQLRSADILLKTGYLYHENEDIIKALYFYEKCLKIYQELDDNFGISAVYNEYGSIYKAKGEYQKSLEYYFKSIAVNNEYNDESGNASMYNNIGDLYFIQEKHTQSITYFQKALALSEQANDLMGVSAALTGIANVYAQRGEYDYALEQLKKCQLINEQIGYTLGISNILIDMGDIYMEQKRFTKAISSYEEGFRLAKDLGDIGNQESSSDGLFKAYRAIGNQKEALNYLENKIYFNDSLKSEETAIRLQQLEFKRQVQADSLIQIEKDLKVEMYHQAVMRTKDRNRNLAIGFGIFFLFVSGGLYSRWSYIKKSKAILQKEKDRSENLLLNILPEEIAEELKEKGEAEARDFELVSILFTDFKGFTQKSEHLTAKELIEEINECFIAFDHICGKYGIEKIKTIGDAYMAAGGVPVYSKSSTKNTILAAIEMQDFVSERIKVKQAQNKLAFEMRLGIHTGPVVAGIVGVKKFQYDIWGDTVNTAARMESSGEIGMVNISQYTYELIKDDPQFQFTSRGKIQAKGKGEMEMWFVKKA
ncbi:adenylate/guanylate cyclase domain-containing protein [Lentimicrobium sp. S6]|uniref:adenylate/guanylate cyclase domain-containing protein n=1 Tax=Lentimicrobium sp. S6 TaxID=2735872 RepID=UPI0015516CD7|nr:adenylate/guanylate cyclase domain-containing protein [Lentimicrobium sp. S6]NPD45519.1 tetratricopeptide repeat protein [Lentimicrobium sp. S6]